MRDRIGWAKAALDHTLSELIIGSSNKPSRVKETGGLSSSYVSRSRKSGESWQKIDGKWTLVISDSKYVPQGDTVHEKVLDLARRASSFRSGNCGENAAVAYRFIWEAWDQHRMPLVVGRVSYVSCKKPGDHAFVVIGRDYNGNGSLASWGSEAVVCDPWGGFVCMGTDVRTASGASLKRTSTADVQRVQNYVKHWDVNLIAEFSTNLIEL